MNRPINRHSLSFLHLHDTKHNKMECFIHDLDEEAAKRQRSNSEGVQSMTQATMNMQSTLSGDTTDDKSQTGMTGPSWTGGIGQGENHCHRSGPDRHPDELDCDFCRKH
ncbi:hypothetical protein I4U23_010577 [Adineta vaga]|nr:hypothetical protein I4U23_010577 [Adineta vaga]